MIHESDLLRLAESIAPSSEASARVRTKIQARISADPVRKTVSSLVPSPSFRLSLKDRILRAIHPATATDLEHTSESVFPAADVFARIKEVVLSGLRPSEAHAFSSGFKWVAAFAVFVLVIRSMPVIFLAPPTAAEAGVQLITTGSVSALLNGEWTSVDGPEVLRTATMIRTDNDGKATLIFGSDGVMRLGADTTVRVQDLSDSSVRHGTTVSLVSGTVWVLGLLPPFLDGISVQTSGGVATVNSGSMGIRDDGSKATISVFDRGATVESGVQTAFIVSGERVAAEDGRRLSIQTFPLSNFADPWAVDNLRQDAVHRSEIAKLQEERHTQIAGILPTSIFYPAKRLAEEVDVLFTLTQDGKAEKRLWQANTRLNEALALIGEGQGQEAQAPLAEYKDSLLAMAGQKSDNIVKYTIKKQIAEASIAIGAENLSGTGSVTLLAQAVTDIGAALPGSSLESKDIEGYVLVDALAKINDQLSQAKDTQAAAQAYAGVRPYIVSLLDAQSGAHPLLRKEATALLVSTSAILRHSDLASDPVLAAMQSDVSQFLPAEQEEILVTEERLNRRVKDMVDHIFVFQHPRSRYNQLLAEMAGIEGDPNRGTLLRRLKAALPEGLGEYVNTEIQKLGDELKN